MTQPEEQLAPTELSTTRLRGGRSAWLIALVGVAVLGVVVYLGVSGPRAIPARTPTPFVAVAAPSPTPRPSRNTSFDPNEIVSIRADPDAPVLYQYLGTGLTINGRGVLAILDSVEPDHYRGIYRIPVTLSAPTAHLEFDSVSASVSHDQLDRIGQWTFSIDSIARGTGSPKTVLDMTAEGSDAKLANPDFQRLLTFGYRITITTQNEGDDALMTIDVIANPDESPSPSGTDAATR